MTTTKSEEWRSVPDFECIYEVSTEGRVRSFDRPYHRGRILRGSAAGDGYRKVILCDGDRRRHEYVHRLVLEAFVGPCPPGAEACHANARRDDNRLSNLRWDTHGENVRDIVRVGNHSEASKTHCPRDHRLEAPNLVASELRSGHRKCKACNRARAYAQRNHEPMSSAIADDYYREIAVR